MQVTTFKGSIVIQQIKELQGSAPNLHARDKLVRPFQLDRLALVADDAVADGPQVGVLIVARQQRHVLGHRQCAHLQGWICLIRVKVEVGVRARRGQGEGWVRVRMGVGVRSSGRKPSLWVIMYRASAGHDSRSACDSQNIVCVFVSGFAVASVFNYVRSQSLLFHCVVVFDESHRRHRHRYGTAEAGTQHAHHLYIAASLARLVQASQQEVQEAGVRRRDGNGNLRQREGKRMQALDLRARGLRGKVGSKASTVHLTCCSYEGMYLCSRDCRW